MIDALLDLYGSSATALAVTAATALFAMAVRTLWSAGIPSLSGIGCGALGGYLGANLLLAGYAAPVALLAGGLAGFWLGLVLAMAVLRLPVSWQALMSLALIALIMPLARLLPGWTGGREGLAFDVAYPVLWVFLTLALALLLAARLDRSWFARASGALRQDLDVAAGLGIQAPAIQALAYGFAGLLGGLGGVALVLAHGAVSPPLFSTSLALIAIAATLLGGVYHWLGPLLGTILIVLPSVLLQDEPSAIQNIAVAVVVVVLLIFLPRGLLDPRESSRRASRARHRQRAAVPAMAPIEDRTSRRRRGSSGAHRSRLDAAIKRRTGGPT